MRYCLWAPECDGTPLDGRRSRSEESDDESDTGEKEERETKDKVEGCVQEGHADCRTERGR